VPTQMKWNGRLQRRPARSSRCLSPLDAGIADAWQELAALMKRVNAGELTSADVFGTREFLKNNYGYRFIAAKLGIYGNSRDEAFYIPYLAAQRSGPGSHSRSDVRL
jgi:hypothetical protein